MKLYLDTADTEAWRALMPTGLFHGITTNPLLAARAGFAYRDMDWAHMASLARDLGAQELHAQVFGPTESYVAWSEHLYEVGASAGIETIVKIPLVASAIRETRAVKALGGRILMTACYDAKQMFIAQSLGADFIAPYFGRMKEAGINAEDHIETMQTMSALGGCEVLVASLRSAHQMVDLARVGADVFTIAPLVAEDLLKDDNTMLAFEQFEASARM